ncbi:MAG: tRNA (adenosine(37)-N6)-dimethylallyltransferase MiaA [Erythrobacter sp.]|uniref:tRNA (adenosine(37)-N6)-dimethylallyltransferase MiaA n=1 Tax=Erythrobacter sp. TaxID=1042 RepID=UPI00261EEB0B|nr:tRNA (adenosine(37)-N6)-dimethylallyltransferase MiaA [Erythrobacter sp.]MDJ0977495.1 tRNA (adenosine(37)-N6)-dimethylallyltransferase MiaA [Erythrobacter sp.]
MSTTSSPENSTPDQKPERPVALIAGPTASGKSTLAVTLAKAIEAKGAKAVVINADSAQVYSDLAVLSARPTEEEMDGIEHRLFGAWDGSVACSAARWAEVAREEIAQCHENGAVPILVGGTGMYIKVLLEGIAPIPEIEPEVRRVVRALPVETAYEALMIEDPERATLLEPTDSQRIARALEVKRSTGVTLSDWHMAKTGGIGEEIALFPLILLPPRDWLYARCDARFEAMLEEGALDEVQALLDRELDPDLPVMRAIGVPEITEFLLEDRPREEVIEAGAQATRNYAKRQYTWFRRQTDPDWPRLTTDLESENIDLDAYFAGLLPD